MSGGNSDIRYALPVPLEGGKVYQATAWCKAEEGTQCRLFFGDAGVDINPPAYQNASVQIVDGTDSWQKLRVVVTLSQDEEMSIYLYSKAEGHSVAYDEIQVAEVLCDMLCDSGFEEGLDFWKSIENVSITDNGRSGRGLRVDYDEENADVWQLLPGIFEAGTTYKASVWCKAFVGDECGIFLGDAQKLFNPPAYENSTQEFIEGNGDWQQLSITLTLTKDEQMQIFLYSNTLGASVIYSVRSWLGQLPSLLP